MLRLVRQYTSITPGSPEYGLGALLYNKLPGFAKARIYDKTGGQKNLTPNELMTLLSDIVKKESTLRQVEQSTNSSYATYHVLEKQGRPTPWKSVERRHAPSSIAPRMPTTRCPFCKRSNYNAYKCRTFSTTEKRRNRTKDNKLCLKGLRGDHRTTSCKRPPCHTCNYHHHPALCFKVKNFRKTPQASNTQPINQTLSLPRRPQEFSLRENNNRLREDKRSTQHRNSSQHVNFSENISKARSPS
ncbi:hypothetical protein RB195_025341 [Necator americanus]|uniref:Uncharacterized protein n=1 Tax=Necator americanus TaxID=51031 RepID=A0ABR1ERW3_NECAM